MLMNGGILLDKMLPTAGWDNPEPSRNNFSIYTIIANNMLFN